MRKDLMTLNQLIEYLSISRATVFRLMKKGGLPHVSFGRKLYFSQPDVDAWIEKQTVNKPK